MTGVLSMCGAALPGPLLGANEGNPKGHFEPAEALVLNDGFLAENDSAFHDPSLRVQKALAADDVARERLIGRITELIETWPDSDLLVAKDPRITAVADCWFTAAHRKGFSVKAIVMLRHPREVAASFAARDRLSMSLSTTLWLKYNFLAERLSSSLPRVFVEYSNLLGNWRAEIARISEALSISLSLSREVEIDGFLSQELYRQKSADWHFSEAQDPWTQALYESLAQASRDALLDTRSLNRLYTQYVACAAMFQDSWVEFRDRFAPAPTLQVRKQVQVRRRRK